MGIKRIIQTQKVIKSSKGGRKQKPMVFGKKSKR